MRTLNVFDIGSFVHAGAVNTHAFIEMEPIIDADGYRLCRIPCGGIAQVFTKIKTCDPGSTFVFACDRNPTIKKGMCPSYKASRKHRPEISLQKEVTEYILRDCGFTVLSEEGYEADDIIYSIVDKFRNAYDKINIFTADSDLFFLVSDNTEIQPSHSRAKHVTKENYRETVSSNEYVEYNALTYLKIIRGDKSDEIPPLPKHVRERISNNVCDAAAYEAFGKKEFLLLLGKAYGQEFIDQVNLVFPLKVDVPDVLIEHGDMRRMAEWGRSMHCSAFGRGYSNPSENILEALSEMTSLGLYED